jgi:hypothetical protein
MAEDWLDRIGLPTTPALRAKMVAAFIVGFRSGREWTIKRATKICREVDRDRAFVDFERAEEIEARIKKLEPLKKKDAI